MRIPETFIDKVGLFIPAVALVCLGCQEAQPAVNRVQANALKKSIFLDSEWYAHRTVIDTPFSATGTFVGDVNASSKNWIDKIVWDIQEQYLIARRTHEFIYGSEGNSIAGEGSNRTAVVAMYAIDSHFDIRREYSTTTGEELNVVSENTVDRVWYEREYMRVDWSKNLITDPSFTVTGAVSGIELEPVNYYIQAPDDPFAPKFEKDENGEVYYIDIVNKYFATPGTIYVEGYGDIPACNLFFRFHDLYDCQPGEIAVRNSFLRVDPDRDYQPMEYDQSRMEKFGYFLSVRDAYDPNYGVTMSHRIRFANRHNIWKQSHKRDDNGQFVTCTSNHECGGNGSICDLAWAKARRIANGACTIPYREREVKPIAFHLSKNFPPDLMPDAHAMADSWNSAFVDTVGSLRVLECRDASGGEQCEQERDRPDGQQVFVLCHNPVGAKDHEACGAEGTVAEIGDIRFNLIAWISDTGSSPLGYGPSFVDPETGEIIHAAANIYGDDVKKLSARARDLLALINNDLDEEALMSNRSFGEWIRRYSRGGAFLASAFEADNHVVKVDGRDAARINRSMDFSRMRELVNPDGRSVEPLTPGSLITSTKSARSQVLKAVGELRQGDRARARLTALKGTDIEELMINDEMLLAAGHEPGTPLTESVIEAASPLRDMSTGRLRALAEFRHNLGSQHNTCLINGDFMDDGLLGLVREINRAVQQGDGTVAWYGEEYPVSDGQGGIDYSLVQKMAVHPIFNSVTIHEVGHTLGLRHNFAGSYDSLNYHRRYWELRNDGNMQPRAWDPMTENEIDNRIREFQYSSVMDYGHNHVVTNAWGIGHYDRAAIKMGYGDLVEVFTEVPDESKLDVAVMATQRVTGFPWVLDLSNPFILRFIPYTEIPQLVGGLDDQGSGRPRVEALEAREDVRYTSLTDIANNILQLEVEEARTMDAQGRPTVPYIYCGDEFADIEPRCLRWDAGADEYETLMSIMDSYWNYYIYNSFMRQRIGFDSYDTPVAIYSRYLQKLQAANFIYTFFRSILEQSGARSDFYERVDGIGAFTLGIGATYELLSKMVATPEPGCHILSETLDGIPVYSWDSAGACIPRGGVEIDSFDGRRLYSGFEFGPDQSFFFRTSTGYFWDKRLAMEVLTSPIFEIDVLELDFDANLRRYDVSYYTSFGEQLTSLLRGIIGEDPSTFAARWHEGQLVFPRIEDHIDRDLPGTMVDPNMSFTLQLYAMVYGMTLIQHGYDQTFIDKSRLFVSGGAEGVTLKQPEGLLWPMIEFVDEDSGLVYSAPSYPDEEGRETGVAAQMLVHAQMLKESGRTGELDSWMDNLNIMRRLTWLLGFGGDLEVQ